MGLSRGPNGCKEERMDKTVVNDDPNQSYLDHLDHLDLFGLNSSDPNVTLLFALYS